MIELLLTIIGSSGELLPVDSPVKVEIRDTSVADAPSKLLYEKLASVPPNVTMMAMPLRLEIPSVPDGSTVWVHIDSNRDGRVSKGDLITVESYPVTSEPNQHLTVKVRKI